MSKSPKFYDFFPNFYRRIFFTSDDQNGRFQNRVISGNLGKIARFAIRVIPGIVLIEFVLSEDLLYLKMSFAKVLFKLMFADVGEGGKKKLGKLLMS